ncbi:MAG: PqqD family protein [Actinomycetota bacterium]
MTQSTHTRRPVRRSDIWLDQSGENNVALNPETGSVHTLNATATAIWQLCDGETTPEEMIEVVCALSQLQREVIVEDIDRILHDFDESGILEWVY